MTKQSTPLLLLLLFFAFSAFAQQRQFNPQSLRKATFTAVTPEELQERTPIDTLVLAPPAYDQECSDEVTAFGITDNWGTVGGMNEFGDKEKAQLIENLTNTAITITGGFVYFGNAGIVDNGNLRMKVYAVDGTDGSPGTLLGQSDDIKAEDIAVDDTLVLITFFEFSTPVITSDSSFFLSIDLADLYATKDTVGLLHTNVGCGSGTTAYELWADDTWNTVQSAWSSASESFDINFSIFAIVEFEALSAVKDPFYQQGHLRLFPATPNPASEMVRLNFELEKSAAVQLEIYSPDGRKLQQRNLGQRATGRYSEELNVSDLTAGAYIYAIVTDGGRVISRFVVK